MKRIYIVAVVLILIISFIGTNIYKQHEYYKYCSDCEAKHVTFNQLEEIKSERSLNAESNILEYRDHIANQTTKLSYRDLNEAETNRLDTAKVKKVYDEDKVYSVDELISLEDNYKKINDELDDLEHDNSERTYKLEISGYLEEIKQNQNILETKELTVLENKELKVLNEELDDINYDEKTDYSIGTLGDIKREIKALNNKYNNITNNL